MHGARRRTFRLRSAAIALVLAAPILLPALAPGARAASPAPAPSPAAATPGTAEPAATDAPVTATLSILVTLLSGVDLDAGTFDATFYLGVRCDRPCEDDGWEVMNATELTTELVTDEDDERWWRVMATLVFSPDLHRYPFDVQSLPIVIEHVNDPIGRLRFAPDIGESGVDGQVRVSGWGVGSPTFTTRAHDYPVFDDAWDQATFAIPLRRDAFASIVKYFLALAIFVLLGAATLVLVRNDYHIRVGGTALVGLTIFYLATSADVVAVGYFTLWDAAIVLAYVSLFLVLVCGIRGAWLYNAGRYEGPEGAARSLRLRLRFLALIGVLFIGGISAILAVGLSG